MLSKRKGQKLNRKIPEDAIIPRSQHVISNTDISVNALKVLSRLHQANYEAYLVGGSVRDLLLRIKPKDFDIATSATPAQIKKLFRNCRLIGRRFRLAHIHFGREIIEVATFRAGATKHHKDHQQSEDGLLLRDNVYGTVEDDAWRRDFTVNALYYDDANHTIIDFTGGFKDLQDQAIKLIGDPEKRYREDPVRILRAIRFAAKLALHIDPQTEQPIAACTELLEQIPAARLFEEVVKLFHSGKALTAYQLLTQYDVVKYLFPQTVNVIQQQLYPATEKLIQCTLQNTDNRISENKPVTPAFLFAALLWHPLLATAKQLQDEGLQPLAALEKAMGIVISEQVKTISIPRRFTQAMREIWLLQYRLPRLYKGRILHLYEHPRFRAAYDFFALRADAGEANAAVVEWWTTFQELDQIGQEQMIEQLEK